MERYAKIRTIGKGSYGYAVLVREKSTGKLYVMKVIDVSKMERQQKEDALNEIHVLRALHHPFIITYVESFLDKRCLCIVMEYAEGGDLYSFLSRLKAKQEQPTEKQVTEWFTQLCLALKYVHDHKVLHRDLKSQNVFLTAKGEVKLGDFGISRVLQSTYDCASTVIGTPYYLSPEMCQEKPYNQKSDIWSLGCLLYEMMSLRHAFVGKSLKALVVKILEGRYDPVPAYFSPQLSGLLGELLAKDPARRPSIKRILAKPFLSAQLPLLIGPKASLSFISACGIERNSTKSTTESSEDRKVDNYEPVQPSQGDEPPDMLETGTLQGDAVLQEAVISMELGEMLGISRENSLADTAESIRFYLEGVIGAEILLKLCENGEKTDFECENERIRQLIEVLLRLETAIFGN